MKEYLSQGYYVIALMGPGTWTRSGHFVLLWAWDDKVRINDPASTKEARLNGDPATFRNEARCYWLVDARNYNATDDNDEEDENMPRYNTLEEIEKNASYALPTVKKLIAKKAIQGGGKKDENGYPADMDLSRDMLRLLTFNDRAGAYGD